MTANRGTPRTRWALGMMAVGVVVLAAACVTQPTPPKSTTTTTHPATTTTTLAATTTTTTLASTTTTTLAPCTATGVTPNPIPTNGASASTGATINVSLCYAGLPANKRLFITECNESTSTLGFDPFENCSNLSEVTVNPSDDATGTGRVTFPAFYGPEPSGDDSWGCFRAGDTAPAGITKNTTCYVRITDDTETNLTDQQSVAVTFS